MYMCIKLNKNIDSEEMFMFFQRKIFQDTESKCNDTMMLHGMF